MTTEELVERAKAKVKLPKPAISTTPCMSGSCTGTVGVPVWFWMGDDQWSTLSDSASAGDKTVKIEAKPTQVTWSLGDGQSVTCDGPGTPYRESMGWATSPDCGIPNGYKSMGYYTMSATVTYDVSWSGAADGSETVTRTSSQPITVREIQTVIK